MDLGSQLKAAQLAQEEAARQAQLKKQFDVDEARLQAELHIRFFFNYAFSLFEFRLKNGQPPGHVALGKGVSFAEAANALHIFRWKFSQGASWREHGHGIWSADHEYHALWLEFENRCQATGLSPKWSYCYDSGGTQSWCELTVEAA